MPRAINDKSPVVMGHKQALRLALCQRDYEIMSEHYPDILEKVEAAINEGISAGQIRAWATGWIDEPVFLQRLYNAATWLEAEREKNRGPVVGVDGKPERGLWAEVKRDGGSWVRVGEEAV